MFDFPYVDEDCNQSHLKLVWDVWNLSGNIYVLKKINVIKKILSTLISNFSKKLSTKIFTKRYVVSLKCFRQKAGLL